MKSPKQPRPGKSGMYTSVLCSSYGFTTLQWLPFLRIPTPISHLITDTKTRQEIKRFCCSSGVCRCQPCNQCAPYLTLLPGLAAMQYSSTHAVTLYTQHYSSNVPSHGCIQLCAASSTQGEGVGCGGKQRERP